MLVFGLNPGWWLEPRLRLLLQLQIWPSKGLEKMSLGPLLAEDVVHLLMGFNRPSECHQRQLPPPKKPSQCLLPPLRGAAWAWYG